MRAEARVGDHTVRGLHLGRGDGGEWFVAERDGDEYQVVVLGGEAPAPDHLVIQPARDRDYETLLFALVHLFGR